MTESRLLEGAGVVVDVGTLDVLIELEITLAVAPLRPRGVLAEEDPMADLRARVFTCMVCEFTNERGVQITSQRWS